LKAGSEDWLDMSLKLKKLRDEFNPLAQFAQFCSTKSTAKMLGAMQTQVALSTSDLPFKGNNAADKAALAEMMKPAPPDVKVGPTSSGVGATSPGIGAIA